MKIYLLEKLEGTGVWSTWVTLEAFKTLEKAEERMKELKKENMSADGWSCRFVYDVKEINLK